MEDADTYLLRPAEVVHLLGVSRSWLYHAAKSGRIPCVRLGGRDGPVRFESRELMAWIERSRAVVDPLTDEGIAEIRCEVHGHRSPGDGTRADVGQLRLIPPANT